MVSLNLAYFRFKVSLLSPYVLPFQSMLIFDAVLGGIVG